MTSSPAYEENEDLGETPLERAARAEADAQTGEGADARDEREADAVIGDVGDYVARTDPAGLPGAQAQLDAWQIPTDPLEGVPGDVALRPGEEGEPLVSVFSAGTESEANIVRGLLESEGVPAIFRDASAPGAYGSVFGVAEARWGDLLVGAAQADLARQIIAAAQEPAPGETSPNVVSVNVSANL